MDVCSEIQPQNGESWIWKMMQQDVESKRAPKNLESERKP